MRWPWSKPEIRQNFTDTVVAALVANARGTVATGLSSAIETCAGWWSRGFASAEIMPAGPVADLLTPWLGFIGRSLIKDGEAVFAIDASDGVSLIPACSVNISGGPDKRSWIYELQLAGPSATSTRVLPSDLVLHLYADVEPGRPWHGLSAIAASKTTKTLLTQLEQRLAEEVGGGVGTVGPVPDATVAGGLQDDLDAMRGGVALVTSTSLGWGTGATGAPTGDFNFKRLGANPPPTLAELRRDAEDSILAACGLPLSALRGHDAASSREGFRRFQALSLQPVARTLSGIIAETFEEPQVHLNFDRLGASDLTGRSRAVGTLVQAGVPLDKALEAALILED